MLGGSAVIGSEIFGERGKRMRRAALMMAPRCQLAVLNAAYCSMFSMRELNVKVQNAR
jgi:hypothetical protein